MAIWIRVFFPPSGEPYSPEDFIFNLPSRGEQGQILHRLETLSSLKLQEWSSTGWVKNIKGDLWQLKTKMHRVYYCLDHRAIVVVHVCRKKGQKARPQDIQRAELNYAEYMARKEA